MPGTFWTSPSPSSLYTPKQQHLFMVQIGSNAAQKNSGYYGATTPDTIQGTPTGFYMWGEDDKTGHDSLTNGHVWYAKTVSKPSLSYEKDGLSDMYFQGAPRGLRDFNYSSAPVFGDVKLTLIDPTYPNATRKLLRILNKITDKKTGMPSKELASPQLSPFRITQYSHKPVSETTPKSGTPGELYKTEEWVLFGPQLVSIDFGSLDYSSDDLVEITMTVAYQGYVCTMFNFGGEGKEVYKSFTGAPVAPTFVEHPPPAERKREETITSAPVVDGVTQGTADQCARAEANPIWTDADLLAHGCTPRGNVDDHPLVSSGN